MSTTLNQILAQRLHRVSQAQRSRHFAVSCAGHGLIVAAFLVLPILLVEPPEPFDYVAVTVVPPKALGVEEPPPPKPDPPKQKEAPPPPPPPQKKEEPKPKPVEPERPVLATKKPPEKTPPKPAPKPPPKAAPAPPASPLAAPPKRKGNPLGNPLGASTTEATVGVEDPNFTYGYYLDRIVSMISQNWNRPPVGGEVKDALIHFRILRDGKVEQLTLKRSSGNEVFDRTALGAVQITSPLPPLPKGYKRDFLGINLIVK